MFKTASSPPSIARAPVFHSLEIRDFSQSRNVLSLSLLYQVDNNLISSRRDAFDDKSEGGEWSTYFVGHRLGTELSNNAKELTLLNIRRKCLICPSFNMQYFVRKSSKKVKRSKQEACNILTPKSPCLFLP